MAAALHGASAAVDDDDIVVAVLVSIEAAMIREVEYYDAAKKNIQTSQAMAAIQQ
jgi:hypothetical protein